MARPFAYKFYKSTAWKDCREGFIRERQAIDGGMCMRCHEEPGYIVHHKVHLSPGNINDPEVSLNHSNMEYLCLSCHSSEHAGRRKLRCRFDKDGRPLPDACT